MRQVVTTFETLKYLSVSFRSIMKLTITFCMLVKIRSAQSSKLSCRTAVLLTSLKAPYSTSNEEYSHIWRRFENATFAVASSRSTQSFILSCHTAVFPNEFKSSILRIAPFVLDTFQKYCSLGSNTLTLRHTRALSNTYIATCTHIIDAHMPRM